MILAQQKIIVIPGKTKSEMQMELKIPIPKGTYARIALRSGLTVERFIGIEAAVVDADYHREVGVVLSIMQMTNSVSIKRTGLSSSC